MISWSAIFILDKPACLFNEVRDLGEELEEGELEIGTLCGSTSVSRRTSDNNGAVCQHTCQSTPLKSRDALWVLDPIGFQVVVVVLDSLEDFGVSVCGLYEGSSLALEYTFGTRNRRIDQSGNFESRTKLVLESEGVAVEVNFGDHNIA